MHPQNMPDNKWNTLTTEQRLVELEHQRLTDKYNTDADHCRRESKRTMKVKIPGGGMSAPNSFGTIVGDIIIYLGEDREKYSQCMKKEGWDISQDFFLQGTLATDKEISK